MKITIGRTSGPVTDKDVGLDIEPDQLDLVKDILAVVNKATNDKEGWYVTPEGETCVVPIIK